MDDIKNHEFFNDLDFNEVSSPEFRQVGGNLADQFLGQSYVIKGQMIKRNQWGMDQKRYFELRGDGCLFYYQDYRDLRGSFKGMISIGPETKAMKGRNIMTLRC